MTLDQLKPGESGIITVIGGEGALRRRLLDMGLTPKTKITVNTKTGVTPLCSHPFTKYVIR